MFKQGDKLKAIVFENDETIRVGCECNEIIVVMECGQMSEIPWFEVWNNGELVSKWNAAMVTGVIL